MFVMVNPAISRGADPSAGLIPSHPSDSAITIPLNRDSSHLEAALIAASDSAKKIIRTNDSLARIDSIRKLALSNQLRKVRSADTMKQKVIRSKLDSMVRNDSLRKKRQSVEISKLRKNLTGYPVKLGNDSLFAIHARLGPFSSKERAQAISNRLRRCASLMGFKSDSLVTSPVESSFDILYGETIIMTVTERDALWYNTSPDSLSGMHLAVMKSVIAKYRKEHAAVAYILITVKVIGILAFCALIVFFVRKSFRKFRGYVSREQERLIKGISIKNVSLLTKEKQHRLLFQLIGAFEVFSFIVIGFITLSFLFQVFPWTRRLSYTLIGWTLSPMKKIGIAVFHYLPNIFNIAVIVIITQVVIKICGRIFNEIEKGTLKFRGFYPDWAKPTFDIARFLIYVLAFIMVFPYLPGSDSPIFRGVSVFLGLLFSLGSTSAISNLVAGLVITYMRPFKTGDRIKIGEVTGDVMEKNMLVTRIRTIKNEIITLPNSTILSSHTLNYSTNGNDLMLILHATVTIGYNAPWRIVHKLLIDAALETAGISKEKQPFVLQKSLDDFYISYEINAYTETPHSMVRIYSDLHQNIQDSFNRSGVEIMSPHYRAVRNGNQSTVNAPIGDKGDDKKDIG
jgi:small-conductance mechanosensitive channel